MTIATMTSKGQVTIPKLIREELHLRTGDRLDFQVEENGTLRIRPLSKKVSEVFGAFSPKAPETPFSDQEIKERLSQAFREGDLRPPLKGL